jgi:hypothetical protein
MKGIGLVTCASSLKKPKLRGTLHTLNYSNPLSELEDIAPSHPSDWETMSNTGSLDPLRSPTLSSALEKAFEFKGKAVQNYNIIARIALEINDFVTCNLAITVLADKVKDEQRTEDVHKGLEVK